MRNPGKIITIAAGKIFCLLPGAAMLLACLGGAEPPAVTTDSIVRVWADQIGYQAEGKKILIVASDHPLSGDLQLRLVDMRTQKTVWDLKDHARAMTTFDGGKQDQESGDFVAHLDLSHFKTPGRYYLSLGQERSYEFNIADDCYLASAQAAWKAFYYERADTALPEKFAGAWNHGLDHGGKDQATVAREYKWTGRPHYEPVGTEVLDPTPRDVHGGWWDAGNFDKYMGNTVECHDDLLLGVQLLGDGAKKIHLNIPESGGTIPDVLSQTRWGTEFLIRLADQSGAAFGRVYEKGESPPEADTSPVMLTARTSGATMNRAAALAYAAVVWKERKLDPPFAQKCLDESLKSWKLLETKPHPWPADPNKPGQEAYTGDWFEVDYDKSRALAAACYFSLTGEEKYDKIVHDLSAQWTTIKPGEDGEFYPIFWVYIHAPRADAAITARFREMMLKAGDQVVKQTGENRGYAAGIRGYWWGSNRMIGWCGLQCVVAAELSDEPKSRRKYLDAAEEFAHYLQGRNAIGLCFLTNLKGIGAEHSAMVMFHNWVGNVGSAYSAKYIGEGEGKIGPFPGMLVGGVNGSMKKYVNDLDWRKNPWEYNEPDITYQSPCADLLGYLAVKAK